MIIEQQKKHTQLEKNKKLIMIKKNSTNYFKLYKQEEGNKGSTTRGEQQDSETHTVIANNIQLGKLEHRLVF